MTEENPQLCTKSKRGKKKWAKMSDDKRWKGKESDVNSFFPHLFRNDLWDFFHVGSSDTTAV